MLHGEFICYAEANYFKETGELDRDIGRVTDARNTLTEWAIQGSGQVQVAPEFETMVDVALEAYRAKGTAGEIEHVDKFLDFSDEDGTAQKDAKKRRSDGKKTGLKSLFDTDSEEIELYAKKEA